MKTLLSLINGICRLVPDWLIALIARIAIFRVFWVSGQNKLVGWEISSSTVALFEYEYALPVISPVVAAWLGAYSEVIFSGLILIGLATQLSALALLGMTLVIQLLVYPDAWPTHIMWAVALLYLIRHGGGLLAVDHIICRSSSCQRDKT
ncbi:DoxX family protein [Endozoicomonadaceae bacterium StTr2]